MPKLARFAALLLSLPLSLLAGCATVGTRELASEISSLPQAQRDRVWPIFINSPLDRPQLGRLTNVARFIRKSGFEHATFLDWTDGPTLAAQIQRIRSDHPDARIALIAWSGASLWAWDAAALLGDRAIRLDRIIYLDSNWLKDRLAQGRKHPDNVAATLLIYRRDNPLPEGIPRSTSVRIDTPNHLAVASNPQAIAAIVQELIQLGTQDSAVH